MVMSELRYAVWNDKENQYLTTNELLKFVSCNGFLMDPNGHPQIACICILDKPGYKVELIEDLK